ncbi:MAG: GatB/YqeY domain-containing protein [Fretibacterium sp.]|nr:GatB/YqeY domain-containing protein [Fretibacterium sp.]
MSFSSQIASDLLAAMKGREELRLSVLRMLKAELQKAQSGKGRSAELTEDESQALLRRLIKQRKEAAEQYRTCGVEVRAALELEEAAILEAYLPPQLSDEELDDLIRTAAEQLEATTPRDQGALMKALMPLVAGRAEGKRVSERAKAFLSS